MDQTLYEKYGGFSTVSRIVMSLYDRILDDDEIGPFFDDVDMPKLMDHQTKFVSELMGGPAAFSDKHLSMAHRHLKITDAHFDRLTTLIRETLAEFGVTEDDAAIVIAAFEARRALVVG